MDWSLVLISQGIESIIDQSAEDGSWRLIIADADAARAQTAIQLYEAENRHRRWQRPVEFAGLLFDGRAVLWFLCLVMLHSLVESGLEGLRLAGRMDAGAVAAGQWWRLVTATTLHADLPHLIANTSTGIVLLGFAMGAYGVGFGLFGALLAGVFGNLCGLWLHPTPYHSLGASGMIMGSLGLLAAHSFHVARRAQLAKLAWRGLLSGVFLLLLLGFNPASDIVVHIGGFAGGIWVAPIFEIGDKDSKKKSQRDTLALVLALALVLLSWALALVAGK